MHTDLSAEPTATAELNPALRRWAAALLIALIIACVLWEGLVAPLRPGGSWLILKVLPLLLPLRGILRGNLYTFQWTSMLSLLYVMEGAVRAFSDQNPASIAMAWVELLLATGFFVCAVAYVRPAKRAHKARIKGAAARAQSPATESGTVERDAG